MLILDITGHCIIYGTYCCSLIFLFLFIANFVGHFKFNYKCPCIIKNEEIGGIYPTLLTFYLLLSIAISSFIIHITWEDDYQSAHHTIQYNHCYIQFSIYSLSYLSFNVYVYYIYKYTVSISEKRIDYKYIYKPYFKHISIFCFQILCIQTSWTILMI